MRLASARGNFRCTLEVFNTVKIGESVFLHVLVKFDMMQGKCNVTRCTSSPTHRTFLGL